MDLMKWFRTGGHIQPMSGEQGVSDLDESGYIPWAKYGIYAVILLAVAGALYLKTTKEFKPASEEKPKSLTTSALPIKTFKQPMPEVAIIEPTAAEEIPAYRQEPDYDAEFREPEIIYIPSEPVIEYRDAPTPEIPRVGKGRSSGVTVVKSSAGSMATTGQQEAETGQSQGSEPVKAASSQGVDRVYATKLTGLGVTILQGVNIPCVLNNSLNTQLAGFATCTVSENIYSADSSRILIAKGSEAHGEYGIETTSGAVARIGVIWGRMVTTDKNAVNLGSPAADMQGAAGIPADSVNYNFWKKFRDAFVVSLIEGAIANIGSTGSDGDVVVNSATGPASQLASQVLGATIGLPATRTANRGKEILIHLKYDLVFEDVL